MLRDVIRLLTEGAASSPPGTGNSLDAATQDTTQTANNAANCADQAASWAEAAVASLKIESQQIISKTGK